MTNLRPMSIAVAVFLVMLTSGTTGEESKKSFIYSSVSPLSIFPGTPFPIHTTLERADNPPVTFKFTLQNDKDEVVASAEEFSLSDPATVKTVSILGSNLLLDSYNLSVVATDAAGNVEKDRLRVQRDFRNTSILVQTDKPVYKPGEKVRFRVFLLNRYLQPFEESREVTIKVSDPLRNLIKLWKDKEIEGGRGFVSEEFELSVEPNLGNWAIEVREDSESKLRETQSFSVDEYVLPKYKVSINLSPPFVTYNDSKLIAEVSATYSYGKPVDGECTVELKDPNKYYYRMRRGRQNQSVIKTATLEQGKGVAKIEFDVKAELGIGKDEVRRWGKNFDVFASCRDSASGNVRNATETFKMYEFPFKIELVRTSMNIVPGFPVNLTIKVSSQDDLPVSDDREDALKIRHGFNFAADDGTILTSIPANGLVPLSFMAATNPKVCYEGLDVTYKGLQESLWLPGKFVSPTGSYMQLTLLTKNPVEGQPIDINVRSSKDFKGLNVFVISRGVVSHSELVKSNGERSQDFSLTLPPKSSPKAFILAYTIYENDVVVADRFDLTVKADMKNSVQISLSEKTVEPGNNVSINVKGLENSVFGLRAVDQSVLLLKQDNDLSREKLEMAASRFQPPGYWRGGQIFQQFIQNGVGILTNGQIDKGHDNMPRPYPIAEKFATADMEMAGPPPPGAVAFAARPAHGGGAPSAPPKVRSFFPETWIWEEIKSPEGEVTLHKSVPDTITSWMISAFQVNAQGGLGLSDEPSKLTVFRPFFIALNLPYSIVKGEELLLQILVHNYQDKPVNATVTLENHEEFFKFLDAEETFDKLTKEVAVNASSISTVVFPIVATKFGTMTLKVTAISDEAGDAVSRPLIVKPPGIKHTQSNAVLVNLLSNSTFEQESITAIFPEQRVPDADFVKVQVIGDILGATMDNLDKLIRLPSGCGEQNMVNFVPDIVVLDYLNATGTLLPEVEIRAKRYLERGYQRQLTYLHYDGSYSAFGKSDASGSTWLTAFVTRAFIQAQKHIAIDRNVISKSLRFLLHMQNDNGSFSEEGFVYDKSLQGPSGSNQVGLTAYVLLTVVEAQNADYDLSTLSNRGKAAKQVIDDGVKFLLKVTTDSANLTDVYAINLVSYLLHVIDHPKKDDYFKMSQDLARIDEANGTMYWKQIQRQKPTQAESKLMYRPWRRRTTPANVELTSYGLLTYLLKGEEMLSEALPIAKWLMKQRNSYGGFISTQDTVMGITALGKFAEAIAPQNDESEEDGVINVKLTYGEDGSHHDFFVGPDNRTVLQEYFLPVNTREVGITGSGKGTALAQLTWNYYVQAFDTSPAFELTTEVVDRDQGRNLDMNIKFSYKREGKSNMAIVEANTPSGYAFDQEELERLRQTRTIKRYDLEDKDSKVSLYFDSVSKSPVEIKLTAYRVYLVAKHSPGVVQMYDYYDNTQKADLLYDVPAISLCDICKMDDDCELKECKEDKE